MSPNNIHPMPRLLDAVQVGDNDSVTTPRRRIDAIDSDRSLP
jgi:hypothetical protein